MTYSSWTHEDYTSIVEEVRTMQLSLMSLHSSLEAYDKLSRHSSTSGDNRGADDLVNNFLETVSTSFLALRRVTDQTIQYIELLLGGRPKCALIIPQGEASRVGLDRTISHDDIELGSKELSEPQKSELMADLSASVREHFGV